MTCALVIGYGSIGARHTRLLQGRGIDVSVVSRRPIESQSRFASIEAALAGKKFELAIVANETVEHWQTIVALRSLGYRGRILVEKPLASVMPSATQLESVEPSAIFVGYNLRFHPALQRLRKAIAGKRLINVCVHAGQDLRTWRAGREVKSSYSADTSRGGGVLRDLSHELDYVEWIFGSWQLLISAGGQVGPMEIDADDCWGIMLRTASCPVVSIGLDYYNQPGIRRIVVNTEAETISLDLIRHSYLDSAGESTWQLDRDYTYVEQLKALLGEGDERTLCPLSESLCVMRTIEAIEQSSRTKSWITQ